MKNQEILIENQVYEFSGESDDYYFNNLTSFYLDNSKLEEYLSFGQVNNRICLDIGANIGLTAILMSHYNKQGKVYAFEPSPINLQHLHNNIKVNNIKNTSVLESAVGNVNGFTNFNLPVIGAHSTVNREKLKDQNYAKVQISTLDKWVDAQNIDQIDLIKIDVEGFEPQVLKGAIQTIIKHKPNIWMEFNSITTIFESRLSPLIFAEVIWNLFDVFSIEKDQGRKTINDPREFAYLNIIEHGCIDDILLVLKTDISADRFHENIDKICF